MDHVELREHIRIPGFNVHLQEFSIQSLQCLLTSLLGEYFNKRGNHSFSMYYSFPLEYKNSKAVQPDYINFVIDEFNARHVRISLNKANPADAGQFQEKIEQNQLTY